MTRAFTVTSGSGTLQTTAVIPLDVSGVFSGAENEVRYYSGTIAFDYAHPAWSMNNVALVNFIRANGIIAGQVGFPTPGAGSILVKFPELTYTTVPTPATLDYQIKLTGAVWGGYQMKVFTGPSATTTLRALAVKSGSVTYAISGGIYANQTPYETWSASIPWNGADSSPAADPNGDGVNNLLAYALGGNPLANASAILPVAGSSGGEFTLTHTRVRADITYLVQTSPTMAPDSWTTVGVNQGSGAVGASVSASVPVGSEGRCFLRLRVIR